MLKNGFFKYPEIPVMRKRMYPGSCPKKGIALLSPYAINTDMNKRTGKPDNGVHRGIVCRG